MVPVKSPQEQGVPMGRGGTKQIPLTVEHRGLIAWASRKNWLVAHQLDVALVSGRGTSPYTAEVPDQASIRHAANSRIARIPSELLCGNSNTNSAPGNSTEYRNSVPALS
jgi:hypothetical protein